MTCPHCADKDERIAWLESELGLRADAARLNDLRTRLRLAPREAKIALLLASASGVVTHAQIEEAIPEPRGDNFRHETFIRVYIAKLRDKLGSASIESVYGLGYQMRPEAKQRVLDPKILSPKAEAA